MTTVGILEGVVAGRILSQSDEREKLDKEQSKCRFHSAPGDPSWIVALCERCDRERTG